MKQGDRMAKARTVTPLLVLAAVVASLAFDIGLGTPSAFGIGQFFLLCPLGGLEALLASKALVPVTLISLVVVVAFGLVFGRAWCAWGCPAPAIRRFFKRDPKPEDACGQAKSATAKTASTEETARRTDAPSTAVGNESSSNGEENNSAVGAAGSVSSVHPACSASCGAKGLAATLRHLFADSRTWVLAAVLVATLVAGLPLFCLVCPIGLTFGTVGSLWHLIVDKQVTLSAVVFPAALAVELVLYRKWCINVCPVAGLLNVFGHFARTFRPQVEASTCLQAAQNKHCAACTNACPEHIDLHAGDASLQLGACTRCGECVRHCPTQSIHIAARPGAPMTPMPIESATPEPPASSSPSRHNAEEEWVGNR